MRKIPSLTLNIHLDKRMRGRKNFYQNKTCKRTIRVLSENNRTLFADDTPVGNKNDLLHFLFQQKQEPDQSRVIYFLYFPELSKGDQIVCKIGYAMDLASRVKSIESSYKQKVIVVNAISVMSIIDETQFHRLCRTKFPYLVYGDKIGKSFRREMYLFHPSLYRFYSLFCSKFIGSSVAKKIEYD